ncbi:MAG: DNA starvation/stationary phase protection protein Dps [Blastocatellia bacterium]
MSKPQKERLKLHKTSIDLDSETREQVVALLNQQLADTFDLYSQTKQAHWNVKGMHFIQLHELFDQLATGLLPHVDDIAERVTTLGGTAMGTARMAAGASLLPEYSADTIGSRESVEALIKRYAALAASTRAAIDTADDLGDADTADLFTAVSRELDKSLWFLEAHVQA